MITVEQIVNTQKSNIDTFFGLTGKAFEGVEKLIELNLSAAKTAISEAAQTTKLALSAKDPQELVALQAEPDAAGRREGRRLRPLRVRDRRLDRRRSPRVAEAKPPKRKPSSCDRRHGRQERAGRHRERRRPDQVGGRRREQRASRPRRRPPSKPPKSPKRTSTRCPRPPSARPRARRPERRAAEEGAARAPPPIEGPEAIRAFFSPGSRPPSAARQAGSCARAARAARRDGRASTSRPALIDWRPGREVGARDAGERGCSTRSASRSS